MVCAIDDLVSLLRMDQSLEMVARTMLRVQKKRRSFPFPNFFYFLIAKCAWGGGGGSMYSERIKRQMQRYAKKLNK